MLYLQNPGKREVFSIRCKNTFEIKKSLSNTLQAKLEQLHSLNITYKQQVSEYFSS